jgi:exodeoxyribonuclease V alpha subunit
MVANDSSEMKTTSIEGVVEREVYVNSENGWSVLQVDGDDGQRTTVTGTLVGLREGDRIRLKGQWNTHPKFGRQLEVESFVHVLPNTRAGIRVFLASGRIRGIGKELARRLVSQFGLETLEIIDTEPQRLTEVHGIGAERARRIRGSWEEHRGVQQIMVFLASHGVSPGIAARAYRRYGASALEVVRTNPYRLAEDVFGVGFLTADRIAQNLGVAKDAPERLEAALLHTLKNAGVEGHVFLPRNQLVANARQLLQDEDLDLEHSLSVLNLSERVVFLDQEKLEEPAVYLPNLFEAESLIASRLAIILSSAHDRITTNSDKAIEWFEKREHVVLAANQREALKAALENWAVIITGGPGTGKTTLIKGLVSICEKKEKTVQLAAPTGRAAKRLAEATGNPARTIHRMLEFNPKTREFTRNIVNPIETDLVVIDEASMLDTEIAAHLLSAVPPHCRIVLVGDGDQLPSVGPGNVLSDAMRSGVVKVVRLTHVFRQERGSLILTNAHRINNGRFPELQPKNEARDFFLFERDDPDHAAATIIEVASRRIPDRFNLDPIFDVQVLSPMRRGPLGVIELNRKLQDVLTPRGDQLEVGARRFRIGDKIMQLRNNYDLDIFNGDIGSVISIDVDDREIVADFDGRSVEITSEGLDDIIPAYVTTIHKSQGSEYPAVIIALHHQHFIMLQRNLLYTAVTRGKQLVVIVGSKRALSRAVKNATVRRRCTMLAERLRDAYTRQKPTRSIQRDI